MAFPSAVEMTSVTLASERENPSGIPVCDAFDRLSFVRKILACDLIQELD
jgi:hypothetical protein